MTNFNDQTWLDMAGNFHSEALHVVERYTRTGPDVLRSRRDDRGSEGVHETVEDQHARLPRRRTRLRRSAAGLRVRGAGRDVGRHVLPGYFHEAAVKREAAVKDEARFTEGESFIPRSAGDAGRRAATLG